MGLHTVRRFTGIVTYVLVHWGWSVVFRVLGVDDVITTGGQPHSSHEPAIRFRQVTAPAQEVRFATRRLAAYRAPRGASGGANTARGGPLRRREHCARRPAEAARTLRAVAR